jgi:16S rRNA (uracil1498-N3)-methyltransferase
VDIKEKLCMNRIFLPRDILNFEKKLTGELHRQVSVILRTRPGERFKVVSGDGYEYTIEIDGITSRETSYHIIDKVEKNIEPSIDIHVYLGSLKGNGMEEILPSLVFLGVSSITPLITERTVAKSRVFSESRNQRIEKIIRRASALSGRTRVLEWRSPENFAEVFEIAEKHKHSYLFWEEAEIKPLKYSFSDITHGDSTGIFIGPEGGFTWYEAEQAAKHGITPVSLGARILDARTAPIAAVSSLLYETENI